MSRARPPATIRKRRRQPTPKPTPRPHWTVDPNIQARLKVVEALWGQNLLRVQEAVNQDCRARNAPEVSYETIKDDRQRVLELYRDRVLESGTLDNHAIALQTLISQSLRDALSAPPGPLRAPLYAVALRAQEDLMRIDGTWTRGTLGLATEPGEQLEERFAPDPAELLAAGLISQQDRQSHLRLLAARAKRLPLGLGDGQGSAGEVIEGQLVEAKPNRARPPGTAAGAVKVVQAVPRAAPKVPDRGPRRRPPAEVPMNGAHPDLDGPREYQPSPWE